MKFCSLLIQDFLTTLFPGLDNHIVVSISSVEIEFYFILSVFCLDEFINILF